MPFAARQAIETHKSSVGVRARSHLEWANIMDPH